MTSSSPADWRSLMGLVRSRLYVNGKPAPGWTTKRDGSILRRLLERRSVAEIGWAIEGLAYLRDKKDLCPDRMRFAAGESLDLRPLWATTDLTPLFTIALRAYFSVENRRRTPASTPGLTITLGT
jgi:hypothetical protein